MESFLETKIREIREQVGSEKVLLGLSGGVDSSVCAALLARAVPGQLTCIYVDHGLMRQGETEEIRSVFENKALDFRCVDAADCFLAKLEGVTDPSRSARSSGASLLLVFEDEAKKLGQVGFLAQGTIYPTSSSPARARRSSRATTTSAGFRRISAFPASWSRCAISSRTRCESSAFSSVCPKVS